MGVAVPKQKTLNVDIEKINKTLFQGPTFKKFSQVHKMQTGHFGFYSMSDENQVYIKKAFSEKVQSPFILGDPYLRDALLQAVQVTAFQTDLLPVGCEKWEINLNRSSLHCSAEATSQHIQEKREVLAQVRSLSDHGETLEILSNLQNRVLKENPTRAKAEDLVMSPPPIPELQLVPLKPLTSSTSNSYDQLVSSALEMRYKTPQGTSVKLSEDKDIYMLHTTENNAMARWPVLFKECRSFGKSVDYQVIIEWMGKIRELVLRATNPGVESYLLEGGFGWVTNGVELMMVNKMPQHGEIIECDFWLMPVPGRIESSIDQRFLWYSIDHSGQRTLVAKGRMRTTWVKPIHHGVVEVAPFPEDIQRVFRPYHQNTKEVEINKNQTELLGENILAVDMSKGFIKLHEKEFHTSQKDSNLVGNVYFSNYFVWQAEVRNDFLIKYIPELKYSPDKGIPVCVNSEITYLRENMPFDTVVVTMALRELRKNGVRLVFEYFKKLDDGSLEKTSFSYHDFVWSRSGKEISPMPLPAELVKAIRIKVK